MDVGERECLGLNKHNLLQWVHVLFFSTCTLCPHGQGGLLSKNKTCIEKEVGRK